MKSKNKMFKALLRVGSLLLVFALVGQAVAQTCTQPPFGMVGWWPGDGNSNDIQGTNHGTLVNGATFAAGMVGQAFSFDGENDFVDIPKDPAIFALTQGTLEMWVRILNLGADTRLFSISEVGIPFPASDTWGLDYRTDGLNGPSQLQVYLINNGVIITAAFTPSNTITDTAFHHIAVVADGVGLIDVYVDGVLRPVTAAPFALGAFDQFFGHAVNADNMKIGAIERDTVRAEGAKVIDEVTIFDRPLSASEIQAIYNAGSAGKCKKAPFAAFDSKVEITLGPLPSDDAFGVKGTFTLGASSDGIDIPTENVSFQLASATGFANFTIPAGNFYFHSAKPGKNGKPGKRAFFTFARVIGGVDLEVKITDQGGGSFEFTAKGTGADLTGLANPVSVILTIGDDGGNG